MPKSGSMANNHAKIAAAAIVEILNGRPPAGADHQHLLQLRVAERGDSRFVGAPVGRDPGNADRGEGLGWRIGGAQRGRRHVRLELGAYNLGGFPSLGLDPMLTLYYAPGACSMAPHIVLEESGEKYDAKRMDLSKGEQRTPEYMKIHPLGRVPALKLDDGSPLTENTAILPYLGKRFGLWPTDPVKEARRCPCRLFRRHRPSGERARRPPRALHRRQGGLPRHPGEGQAEFFEYLKQIDAMYASANGSPTSTRCSIPTPSCSTPGPQARQPVAELKNYTAAKERMLKRPCGAARGGRRGREDLIVHLVDGTYELFRHFYGLRRFTKGKDRPIGAVAGVLHTCSR